MKTKLEKRKTAPKPGVARADVKFTIRALYEVEKDRFATGEQLRSDRVLAATLAKKTIGRLQTEVEEATELLRFLTLCHRNLWQDIGTSCREFQVNVAGIVGGVEMMATTDGKAISIEQVYGPVGRFTYMMSSGEAPPQSR